jgi:hypothetical protein
MTSFPIIIFVNSQTGKSDNQKIQKKPTANNKRLDSYRIFFTSCDFSSSLVRRRRRRMDGRRMDGLAAISRMSRTYIIYMYHSIYGTWHYTIETVVSSAVCRGGSHSAKHRGHNATAAAVTTATSPSPSSNSASAFIYGAGCLIILLPLQLAVLLQLL